MTDPPRVLIVDDDEPVRRLVALAFELEGFEVGAAADGLEAIAQTNLFHPDVVVMDIMMPRMDGLTALGHLRHQRETSDLPVLLLSAKADSADVMIGMRAGATDYVTKPFEAEDLVSRARQAMENPAPRTRRPPPRPRIDGGDVAKAAPAPPAAPLAAPRAAPLAARPPADPPAPPRAPAAPRLPAAAAPVPPFDPEPDGGGAIPSFGASPPAPPPPPIVPPPPAPHPVASLPPEFRPGAAAEDPLDLPYAGPKHSLHRPAAKGRSLDVWMDYIGLAAVAVVIVAVVVLFLLR